MDICEPFLSPIDDSYYIQSELKKIVGKMSKKKLKSLVANEHRRTMMRKKLDDEAELPLVATVMNMQCGMSFADT